MEGKVREDQFKKESQGETVENGVRCLNLGQRLGVVRVFSGYKSGRNIWPQQIPGVPVAEA